MFLAFFFFRVKTQSNMFTYSCPFQISFTSLVLAPYWIWRWFSFWKLILLIFFLKITIHHPSPKVNQDNASKWLFQLGKAEQIQGLVPVVSKSQAPQLWQLRRQGLVEAWAEGQGAKLRGTEACHGMGCEMTQNDIGCERFSNVPDFLGTGFPDFFCVFSGFSRFFWAFQLTSFLLLW